jgi:mRNA-degrading endonuclease RelE of RelBE toxin-antitoxin system
MIQYRVFVTNSFEKTLLKIKGIEKERINIIKNQILNNPFSGKPLGYNFFREKKLGGNRIYYLIYPEEKIVLVIAYSNKKDQQETINKIKSSLDLYKNEINKLIISILLFCRVLYQLNFLLFDVLNHDQFQQN